MANILALPINYGVMRWVVSTKFDYVSGKVADPSGQWTGQDFKSYNTAGKQQRNLFHKIFSTYSGRPACRHPICTRWTQATLRIQRLQARDLRFCVREATTEGYVNTFN